QYIFSEVFFLFDSRKNPPNYSNKKSSSSSNGSSNDSSTVEDESESKPSSRATDSLLISIFHPVNLAAKRAFCPRLPLANDKCWSGTITVVVVSSSLTITFNASDGRSALETYTTGSSDHSTMSIFSPFTSSTTAWTR